MNHYLLQRMNRDDSEIFVDEVLQTLPQLVHQTKMEIKEQLRVASPAIRIQWGILRGLLYVAKDILVTSEYHRLVRAVTEISHDVDIYLTSESFEHAQIDMMWSPQELTQFGTKGA